MNQLTAEKKLPASYYDPTAWALWDQQEGKWLGDANGPRLFRSPTPHSRVGQMMAEMAQKLLCATWVIARPFDPTLTAYRTDIRIPLNL